MTISQAQRRSRTVVRRGAYTVEFALCVPVLLLFTFAGFEFARHEFVTHALQQAAYQGARAGISVNGTHDDVVDATNAYLLTAGMSGVNIEVIPATIDKTTREVTVIVRANFDDYWIPPQYFGGQELVGRCTLDHENASMIVEEGT